MLKLTIDQPNGSRIIIECSDPQSYSDIIASVSTNLFSANLQGISMSDLPDTAILYETNSGPPTASFNHDNFSQFCHNLEPISDMQRVVVVTEGARRFLGIEQVSRHELESLFSAVSWPKPHNFLLTLRNAGSKKFGWLRRVPGNSGYYTVTDKGQQKILPETGSSR